MKLIVGKNDLATTHPELAKEGEGGDSASEIPPAAPEETPPAEETPPVEA
jgi:hypothetical protein